MPRKELSPELKKFRTSLRRGHYSVNSQKMYLWQASKFMDAFNEQQVKGTKDLNSFLQAYLEATAIEIKNTGKGENLLMQTTSAVQKLLASLGKKFNVGLFEGARNFYRRLPPPPNNDAENHRIA